MPLGHLLDAVQPLEDRNGDRDLRLPPVRALQVPPEQQIERLVGAAELDIGAERHRVVGLGERIEELVETDRTAAPVARRKILALEHLGDGDVRRLADDVLEGERREPGRVELEANPCHVEHAAELRAIRFRIDTDLLARELLARL